MLDGLLLAGLLFAWGAQALVPWRLASLPPAAPWRRPLAATLLPLLALGALAAYSYADRHPDAAIVQALYPLRESRMGVLLAGLLLALAVVDLVATAGWRRFDPVAWRVTAGFGATFLVAASLAGELMRIGEGPESRPLPLALLTLLRLLLALAAAETLAPGRPFLAPLAAAALPLYVLLLPARLAHTLWGSPAAFTLAAAAILFLAARWLPPSLRRPALGAATLLAGLCLAQVALLSQKLAVLH
ncbi:MAG TPA: hypothetical protein VF173_19085 [Thermoanaerobaculia bacterium]|nr:hypothetical protein [Thermoanaerobaculia bacterium]